MALGSTLQGTHHSPLYLRNLAHNFQSAKVSLALRLGHCQHCTQKGPPSSLVWQSALFYGILWQLSLMTENWIVWILDQLQFFAFLLSTIQAEPLRYFGISTQRHGWKMTASNTPSTGVDKSKLICFKDSWAPHAKVQGQPGNSANIANQGGQRFSVSKATESQISWFLICWTVWYFLYLFNWKLSVGNQISQDLPHGPVFLIVFLKDALIMLMEAASSF